MLHFLSGFLFDMSCNADIFAVWEQKYRLMIDKVILKSVWYWNILGINGSSKIRHSLSSLN